jgi:signal transduction histidine kinase
VLSAEDLRISKEQLQTLNNELEQRVERRSRKLKDAQVQYLHAVKLSAIGQLSASIAHELNNPLQGVRTILKGVKRRAILEEEDKELLDLAIRENERMKNLIKNLQDFNRPSTGKRMAMDVHASLDSLLLLYKSDFKRNRISTELNYTEGFPQIEVIPDQIKQVFLNLLNNAKDACSEKGGLITISTCHDDQIVAVAIQDTGIGISPDQKDQIFKPFLTTKPEEKGMGLGLSVCKEIVENHQGEIRVESEPGKGSTFTVLLPAIGNGIIKNGNCIITLH